MRVVDRAPEGIAVIDFGTVPRLYSDDPDADDWVCGRCGEWLSRGISVEFQCIVRCPACRVLNDPREVAN